MLTINSPYTTVQKAFYGFHAKPLAASSCHNKFANGSQKVPCINSWPYSSDMHGELVDQIAQGEVNEGSKSATR